jgi:hypothetical protein
MDRSCSSSDTSWFFRTVHEIMQKVPTRGVFNLHSFAEMSNQA